jgi:hypothetical protein
MAGFEFREILRHSVGVHDEVAVVVASDGVRILGDHHLFEHLAQ